MTLRRRWMRTAIMAVVVLVLHIVLASMLADRDSASALLTGGAASAGLDIFLLIAFMASRCMVILFLPGVIVYEVAMTAMTWRDGTATRAGAETRPE